MKKYLLIILLSSFFLPGVYAQYTFSGKITNSDKEPIDAAQVILSVNDSIFAAGYTNENGGFIFRNIPSQDGLL
ncbi:MAG: carboxypeptidase-like regulatory domain-containing protein [Bacteroidales bacterium]|nr:carboxypeptidase-like regulatory domain-containing protein [Bacteroidales bacterium]